MSLFNLHPKPRRCYSQGLQSIPQITVSVLASASSLSNNSLSSLNSWFLHRPHAVPDSYLSMWGWEGTSSDFGTNTFASQGSPQSWAKQAVILGAADTPVCHRAHLLLLTVCSGISCWLTGLCREMLCFSRVLNPGKSGFQFKLWWPYSMHILLVSIISEEKME